MKIKLLLPFLFFGIFEIVAQNKIAPTDTLNLNGQTISFTELLEAIASERPKIEDKSWGTFVVYGARVEYDNQTDRTGMDGRWGSKKRTLEPIKVEYDLILANCQFSSQFWFMLRSYEFMGYLQFNNCTAISANFKNCIFHKTFRVDNSQVEFINFDNCEFRLGTMYQINEIKEKLSYTDCKFYLDPQSKSDNRQSTVNHFVIDFYTFYLIHKKEPFDLLFENCQFGLPEHSTNDFNQVILKASRFNNLQFKACKFNVTLDISRSSIENQFQFEKSTLRDKILIDATKITHENARVEWSALEGNKISVREGNKLLTGRNKISDESTYNRLISCYSTFYQIFKSQGNRIFANQAYIEWKNIETKYLKDLYEVEQNSEKYFLYLMNVFLLYFCDYGTNPLKSVTLSLEVIFFFALIYFLYPYRLHIQNNNTTLSYKQVFRILTQYFSEKRSIQAILARHKASASIQNQEIDFKRKEGAKVPFYLLWIGYFLDNWQRSRQKLNGTFYKLIDIFPGHTWEELKPTKRISVSFYFAFLVLGIVSYAILVRVIDSITLSLNVFSTLGFGETPVRGFVRYLTILEGFIGWFLLSIFSVVLISQVIQ